MLFCFFCFTTSLKRYCVCKPDRPGNVCSIKNKCIRFENEDQIRIATTNDISFETNESIELEIYGSTANHRLTLNLTNFSGNKISIIGGEFQQYVKVAGIQTYLDGTMKHEMSTKVLKTKDVQVEFDTDSLEFEKISIENCFFKGPNNEKIRLKARTVKGNKLSLLKQNFNGFNYDEIIIYNQSTKLSQKNVFGSQLGKNQTELSISKLKNGTASLLKDTNSVPEPINENSPANYYSFCLASKSRLNKTFHESECAAYNVPHDYSHYINVKSNISFIADAPANKTLKFYATSASDIDPISLMLPKFKNRNINISIQLADVDFPSFLNLKSSLKLNSIVDNISLSISNIEQVFIVDELLESLSSLTLTASRLSYSNRVLKATVNTLTTDSISISQLSGELIINQSITLAKASPANLKCKVLLKPNAKIYITQISKFPKIVLNGLSETQYLNGYLYQDISPYYISLSDEEEDYEMSFFLGKDHVSIDISDFSYSSFKQSNLIFLNRIRNRTLNSIPPFINVTVSAPQNGLLLTFGDGETKAWPNNTIFTIDGTYYNIYPEINISIKDYHGFGVENANEYVFMYFYHVDIILPAPEFFTPLINGINYKYIGSACPLPPYNKSCYQVGVYDINNFILNVKDKLDLINLTDGSVFISKRSDESTEGIEIINEIPKIAKFLKIISSTNSVVDFDISPNLPLYNISNFTFVPEILSKIRFSKNFGPYNLSFQKMAKIRIEHETNDVFLFSDGFPIPQVILNDPVQGVHYITNNYDYEKYYTTQSFIGNQKNTRFGPDIKVNVGANTVIPQKAFLADDILIESNNLPATLVIWNKSVAKYTFSNIKMGFSNVSSWDSNNLLESNIQKNGISDLVAFKCSDLKMINGASIVQNTAETKLFFEVGNLSVFSVDALPVGSFSGDIIVNDNFLLSNNEISKIWFSSDSIQVLGNNGKKTVVIKQGSAYAQFTLKTEQSSRVTLSVDGKGVLGNCSLIFSKKGNIFLDKTWNNVDIPNSFSIISSSDEMRVDTELLEIPNISFQNNSIIVFGTHKPKYTQDLGFYIFIAIIGVLFILAIIFVIVGLACFPKEEDFDFSSDELDDGTSKINGSNQNKHDSKLEFIANHTSDKETNSDSESKGSDDKSESDDSNGSSSSDDSNGSSSSDDSHTSHS